MTALLHSVSYQGQAGKSGSQTPVKSNDNVTERELYSEIKRVYDENHGTYGSPRIYQALKKQGLACSENRVARLMRLRGLRAKQKNRYRTTTRRNEADPASSRSPW